MGARLIGKLAFIDKSEQRDPTITLVSLRKSQKSQLGNGKCARSRAPILRD
jgi:hypothetical protein